MNGEFTCDEEVCLGYNSCKIRKSIGLACMLSGLSIKIEGWGCGNNNKTIEIKRYTDYCDSKKCKKKNLIYKLIEKHDKFMRLRILWCENWRKCSDEHWRYNKLIV